MLNPPSPELREAGESHLDPKVWMAVQEIVGRLATQSSERAMAEMLALDAIDAIHARDQSVGQPAVA